MISIILNGQKTEIDDKITLDQLVRNLGLNSKWVVVELNHKAVIKMDYGKTFLSHGDRIELVRAVSGG
jgi:thiamine biosynthesis protein ThiS